MNMLVFEVDIARNWDIPCNSPQNTNTIVCVVFIYSLVELLCQKGLSKVRPFGY